MSLLQLLSVALAVTGVSLSSPLAVRDSASPFAIHESCNATERTQLRHALNEVVVLATHARDHILQHGGQSPYYVKYFGNASTAEPIGWYSRVVSADRGNITFRCDDPDRNCATQDGWAGHWRGSNATHETVICPLSYEKRLPLETVCTRGFTVADSPLNTYFAVDLLHRVLHLPLISEDIVSHFSEDYADALQLAQTDPAKSVRDSDALQLFAIDVYAYDIAVPGVGCSGDDVAEEIASSIAAEPSTTTTASTACHTHADGVVHCESH